MNTFSNAQEELFPIKIKRFVDGKWVSFEDHIAREVQVNVCWNTVNNCLIWAWPYLLDNLVVGHILLDKMVKDINHKYAIKLQQTALDASGNASYKLFIEKGTEFPPAPALLPHTGNELMGIMKGFIETPGLWHQTGCFHRAGLFSRNDNKMLFVTEDIGRHNCVDRIAGWAALNDVDMRNCILFISARITSSICAKAIRAGIRFIVSRSAVTNAAIDMCQEHGVTLCGFARHGEGRFSLFADEKNRIRQE